MYAGRISSGSGKVHYKYYELNDDNEIISKSWSFDCKLFKKGSVGAVYDLKVKGAGIKYSKGEFPSFMVKVGESEFTSVFLYYKELDSLREIDRQVSEQIKLSKAENTLDVEIKRIKQTYSTLSGIQKTRFVANLIFKITS